MRERRIFIAIALLCLLSVAAEAQDQDGYDFRKTSWGMSVAQVKASENRVPLDEDSDATYDKTIVYKESVAGLDATAGYQFISNKLVRGGYVINELYVNKNQHIRDYTKIKEILTRKYGAPSIDRIVWINDLFKDDPQDYGTAVSAGHLLYLSTWQTPSTEILVTLSGKNFDVALVVVYTDKKSKSLIESREKAEEEKDF